MNLNKKKKAGEERPRDVPPSLRRHKDGESRVNGVIELCLAIFADAAHYNALHMFRNKRIICLHTHLRLWVKGSHNLPA